MVFLLREVNTVGRSRTNNIIVYNKTIAKQHAVLETKSTEAFLYDCDTLNGTRVGESEVWDYEYELESGDIISMGLESCPSNFIFLQDDFLVQIDQNMPVATKDMVQNVLEQLKIKISKEYSSAVTHYITNVITLERLKTSPTLFYLVKRKVVVVPEYFTDMFNNIEKPGLLSNLYRYLPVMDDYLKSLNITNLQPKPKRELLFHGYVFILIDENQGVFLKSLIELCGGTAQTLTHRVTLSPDKADTIAVVSDVKVEDFHCWISASDVYLSILKNEIVGLQKEKSTSSTVTSDDGLDDKTHLDDNNHLYDSGHDQDIAPVANSERGHNSNLANSVAGSQPGPSGVCDAIQQQHKTRKRIHINPFAHRPLSDISEENVQAKTQIDFKRYKRLEVVAVKKSKI